jgi:DNA-directed RNA polymerase subunit K/omega
MRDLRMMDISIEELEKRTGNIYESVAIMFKRARQITDEQKIQIEMEMDVPPPVENRDNEDFDEVEIDREALMREHKKYPKPTRVAIDEMMSNKISFEYVKPNEAEQEEKEKQEEK